MESLAYLHLASSADLNLNPNFGSSSVCRSVVQICLSYLDRNRLSAGFLIRLLAISANVMILAIATQTTAQELQFGDSSPEVAALQRCLVARGYLETSTFGNFRQKTVDAVRKFQKDYGLEVDGRVGSQTAAALGCNLTSSPTPASPYYESLPRYNNPNQTSFYAAQTRPILSVNSGNSAAVKELQKLLQRRGLYRGEIDGIFGPGTKDAVEQFQRANSLNPDGVVGSATWAAFGLGGGRPSNPGADKYSVMALQQNLQDQKFYNGAVDGRMGPETERAIAEAQRYYGVTHSEILTGRLPR